MVEEEKKDQEISEQKTKNSKSPLMTYVIVAVGALAVTIGSMLAIVKPPAATEVGDEDEYASHEYEESEKDSDKEFDAAVEKAIGPIGD
ncbi:hypothetical protein IH799_04000 [candidate division KSB1 bacterium]|nr:hypothetical protein [candidate division KSB1 bacterium]